MLFSFHTQYVNPLHAIGTASGSHWHRGYQRDKVHKVFKRDTRLLLIGAQINGVFLFWTILISAMQVSPSARSLTHTQFELAREVIAVAEADFHRNFGDGFIGGAQFGHGLRQTTV